RAACGAGGLLTDYYTFCPGSRKLQPFLLLTCAIPHSQASGACERPGRPGRSQGLFPGHITEGVELFVDLADEALVVRVVAQLHPTEPALMGGNWVGRFDLVPGVLVGIIGEHARGLFSLIED